MFRRNRAREKRLSQVLSWLEGGSSDSQEGQQEEEQEEENSEFDDPEDRINA